MRRVGLWGMFILLMFGLLACTMETSKILKIDLHVKGESVALSQLGNKLLVATDHSLRAIDPHKAEIVWQFDLPSMSYLLQSDETGIFAATNAPALLKINPETGKLDWEYKGFFPKYSIPFIDKQRGYFPQIEGFAVLSYLNGKREDSIGLAQNESINESFLGMDAKQAIFQIGQDSLQSGFVSRYNAENGALVWKADSLPFNTLSLTNISLSSASFIGCSEPNTRTYFLLSKMDGDVKASQAYNGAFEPVLIDDNHLLFQGKDNQLVLFDPTKNTSIWTVELPNPIRFKPFISGKFVTVVSDANQILILSMKDGVETKRIHAPNRVISSCLFFDQMAAVVAEDGFLYCFEVGKL